MPCTGLEITGTVITCLDYTVLWDISGAAPIVTITNNSTVPTPSGTKWWFYVGSPSGIPIYGVDLNNTPSVYPTIPPDVDSVAWTTKTIALPTPFGNQIEFSNSSPYTVTVFVADDPTLNPNPFYSLSKTQIICRPNGNTQNTFGNFGAASVDVTIQCQNAKIFGQDKTNYAYQTLLGTPFNQQWTLVYPADSAGNIPTNATATNAAYVLFPINYTGEGYSIYLNAFATYIFSNGSSVKIQYKSQSNPYQTIAFAVWCNISLCNLATEIHKLHQLAQKKCGQVEYPEIMNKITQISLLLHEVQIGIEQPLCGIDVPKLIKEIEKIGNFDCNCCGSAGVNFGNAIPVPSGTSGCCPSNTPIWALGTTSPPTSCETGAYFPANVYAPNGTTIIGVANSSSEIVSLMNGNGAWSALGTAFDEGSCQVGFYPVTVGTVVPSIIVDPIGTPVVPPVIVTDTMVIVGGSTPPTGCPATTPFNPSLRIYDASGVNVIGIAYTINDVVSILNGDASWNVFGTWSVQDNCTVQCNLTNPASIPGTIPVDTLSTSDVCVNGKQFYVLNLNDYCIPATVITAADFPLNAVVNFGIGGGNVSLGIVADMAALIAALNATPTKPAVITFSAGYTINNIIVTNTNCAIYTGPPVVILDKGSANFLLYGANHANMTSPLSTANGQYGIGLHTMAEIGKIPGATANKRKWHTIKQGSVVADTETDTGKITFYDVSTPLFPTVIRTISLTAVVGTCFTGAPYTKTLESNPTLIPSLYSLYFPTDTYTSMSLNAIVVVESTTGCLWILDLYGSGTGITYSNQFDQLIGKCPRCLINGSLYFTQEGDMETQIGGRPSTVGIGLIPIFDMASHNISTTTIIPNGTEDVWAASFDGANTIYFSGQFATVVAYTVSTAVKTVYPLLMGGGAAFQYRLNTVCFATVLYWVTQAIVGRYCAIMLSVPTLGGTPVIADMQSIVSGTITGGYNFKPLGNCLGVLTIDNFGYGAPGSSILLYKINGQFLGLIDMPSLDIYNVVPIAGVGVYSPTSLV